MPLGLLAKDSIADLEAFAARAEAASSSNSDISSDMEHRISLEGDTVGISLEDQSDLMVVTANPQQAQEEDSAASSSASSSMLPRGPQIPRPPGASASSSSVSASTTSVTPPSGPAKQHGAAEPPKYYYGFETYSKEDYYYHDSYAPLFIGEKKEKTRFWDCIFPCLRPQGGSDPDYASPNSLTASNVSTVSDPFDSTTEGVTDSIRSMNSRDDDEVSTNSDVLGERLSEKERQAVLARLGLAQPSGALSTMAEVGEEVQLADGGSYGKSPLSQKGLLNGIPAYDTSPLIGQDEHVPFPIPTNTKPLKGILKRRSVASKDWDTASQGSQPNASLRGSAQQSQRRSLFPLYESTKLQKTHNHHVTFAPMARVVAVKSKNEMSPNEKGDIWFQKSDYEDFRKTGRIITKAMLEGGSEIWLHSTLTLTDKSNGQPKGTNPAREVKEEIPARRNYVPGDKWWHKFGHSRRGLEHIVSIEEGRQRQSNVRNAIHAVLEEQTRQRRYRREDAEKLRIVSLSHTSWARDLALAAGASDADAVRSSFAEDRKSREFFLLKMARSDPAVTTNRVPEFMQPSLHTQVPASPRPTAAMKAQILDANTAAQIRFRQEKQREDGPVVAAAPPPGVGAAVVPPPPPPAVAPPCPSESAEPIRDPNPDEKKTDSMAQRAKGFLSEGAGKVDMSAVLSGLGAQPSATAVTT